MATAIKRLNYYDQQFLQTGDFKTEQDYHRRMLREHNRAVHPAGIGSGLALTAAGKIVTVSPGTAIDGNGEQIVLVDPRTLDISDAPPNVAVYITIAYRTQTSDPSNGSGPANDTRYTDEPQIARSYNPPPDPLLTLILGVAKHDGTTATIEPGNRMRSGEQGPLSIKGAITGTEGVIAGGVSIGCDPGNGIDYPWEYETVGVTQPIFNLRLQSPNATIVHAGGAERATFNPGGGLKIHADPSRFIELTVASGGNGRVRTRHLDGKHWVHDGDDALHLNWATGHAVNVGSDLNVYFGALRVMGDPSAPTKLIVGAGSNGRLKTRHIDGKSWADDSDDGLFLNWDSGQAVHVGTDLNVHRGTLRILGDPSAPVKLIVGAGSNGSLKTRHIDGKHYTDDSDDNLYLNWSSQRTVETGGGLFVHGADLDWGGDQSHASYIRIGSLQICWGRVDFTAVFGELQFEKAYPAPFAGLPSVTVSLSDNGPGRATLTASVAAYYQRPDAFVMLYKGLSNTVPSPVNATYIAIGRWR